MAEINEICMLFTYVKKYPVLKNIPLNYKLGRGHMLFFKNKLLYLFKRLKALETEMRKRGLNPNAKRIQTISTKVEKLPIFYKTSFSPSVNDLKIIRERIYSKLKLKPEWYKHSRIVRPLSFYKDLMDAEIKLTQERIS
jgi:deoxyribonuclease (pyrimidine dimer)